jgi:hypothetical protein
MGSGNKINDFKPGDSVVYVPTHAQTIPMTWSKDAEPGIVKRCNEHTVFVNYIKNGILQETAQGTDPNDLWHN